MFHCNALFEGMQSLIWKQMNSRKIVGRQVVTWSILVTADFRLLLGSKESEALKYYSACILKTAKTGVRFIRCALWICLWSLEHTGMCNGLFVQPRRERKGKLFDLRLHCKLLMADLTMPEQGISSLWLSTFTNKFRFSSSNVWSSSKVIQNLYYEQAVTEKFL